MKAVLAISPLLCALLIQGCSQSCQPSGIPGRFTLSKSGKTYELQLRPDGAASLIVRNKQVGSVSWKLETTDDERIEIDAQDGSYAELRNLSAQGDESERVAPWPNGLIVFPAKCGRDGLLQSILVNPSSGIALVRARASIPESAVHPD